MKKRQRDTPELTLPYGYSLEDYFDTDDSGYEFENPLMVEEVIVAFERISEQQ